jgi:hypothetical protein
MKILKGKRRDLEKKRAILVGTEEKEMVLSLEY